MTFGTDSVVAASADDVFDKMADARNEPRWNSKVTRSELLSAEPVGAGSQFQTVNRGQVYDATITGYARPTQLTFEVTGKGMDITTVFTMATTDAGTAVHSSFDFRPKGFLKLIFPLMKPMIARDLPKQAANFARFAAGAQA